MKIIRFVLPLAILLSSGNAFAVLRQKQLFHEKPVNEKSMKKEDQPVQCRGDKVEYLRDQQVLRAEGNVLIVHQRAKLSADKAVVFVATGDCYADGHVVLIYRDQVFTGDKMHYNFKTGIGDMVNMQYVGVPWFSKAEVGKKVSDQEVTMQNGYMTTCDLPDPHYKLRGKEIRIYPGDRVVINNLIVEIWDLPVLWFPRYTYPLNDERTRFTVAPGYRSHFGPLLLTGYNFYQSENIKGTFHLDYYADRGLGTGADVTYRYQNEVVGKILTYVIDDRAYQPVGQSGSFEKTRYRVTLSHQQQVSPDTRFITEFNSQSDKDIIHDYFRSEFRNQNQPNNFIDLTKTATDYQITLQIQAQVDDVFNVVERLPELELITRKKRIEDTPIYYSSNHSAGFLRFSHGQDVNPVPIPQDYDSFRFDTFHELSYPKKYLGWLSIEPRVGGRLTGYSDDINGDSRLRGIFSTGFETFTKISKTWEDVEDEFWNIHKLRHVIEPAVQYTYTSNPTVKPEELPQFDGLDSIRKVNQFKLDIRNKLQTQRLSGTADLIDLDIFTLYDPQWQEMKESQPFSDIFYDLEARAIQWLKFDIQGQIDTHNGKGFNQVNTDLVYYYDDTLSFTLGQRFNLDSSNLYVFEIDYQFDPNWEFKTLQRIEAQTGDWQEGEFDIIRDFHDWKSVFSYRHLAFRNSDTFFVMFFLKDFPDLPFKVGN